VLGAAAIVVHILAAALWCGLLVAIAMTVSHRGQWARILPRFSGLAVVCVAVLLVAGSAGALVTMPGVSALLLTGYGRVLLAKIVVAGALVLLARSNRTRWLPALTGWTPTSPAPARRVRWA
jgi:putative copper resistance protein D